MVWNFVIQIAIALVMAAVSYALTPRPRAQRQDAKPAGLDDLDGPKAEEGAVLPVVFGTVELDCHCVWRGDLKTIPIPAQSGGKK